MEKMVYENQSLRIDGKWNQNLLIKNPWLAYLCKTHQNATNVERVQAVKEITGLETLQYVFRTLSLLEQKREELSQKEYEILREVLRWSEVAKGGMARERARWTKAGFPLAIHNLASAQIFLQDNQKEKIQDEESLSCKDSSQKKTKSEWKNEANGGKSWSKEELQIISILISTHGILGQNIRGEVSVERNRPLLQLLSYMEAKTLKRMLWVLNYCVIGAVNLSLWETVSAKAEKLIDEIAQGNLPEYPLEERLSWLCHSLLNATKEQRDFFAEKIFPNYELWYFDSALYDFNAEQICQIMEKVVFSFGSAEVEHITFKPLADSLFYDYEGRKHINIYKKRVIEKYLKDGEDSDVALVTKVENRTAFVDIYFTKVCEKMLDFCVEAERSGMLSYEKSITVLFDLFGLRKDEFDRLNNEDKYLQTMNDSSESTKGSIADYVVGKKLVDVGSGGGIMLDLLEKKYPDKCVIGTDISTNVIEALLLKKQKENHDWQVVKHNFVEGAFPGEKVDSILFSSILHEVFSYTETDKGRFQMETVKEALQNAYDSLNVGGRIIIRDGIKTFYHKNKEKQLLQVTFASQAGLDFFENYARDFKGLPELTENRPTKINRENLSVVGDVNFMREFLYTYTWGNESYSHEVQEQFGYLTLHEFEDLFQKMGAKIVEAREFLEPGYEAHLGKLVSLSNPFTGQAVAFPNSNCIVVVEKR